MHDFKTQKASLYQDLILLHMVLANSWIVSICKNQVHQYVPVLHYTSDHNIN